MFIKKLELARSPQPNLNSLPVGPAGSILSVSVPPFGGLTTHRLREKSPHHTWPADRGQEFGSFLF